MVDRRVLARMITRPMMVGLVLGATGLGLAWAAHWAAGQRRPVSMSSGAYRARSSALFGRPAPPLRLPTLAGDRLVDLNDLRGRRVVLAFSSFSCDLFAGHRARLEHLYKAHRDKAAFYFVHIREAGHKFAGLEFLLEGDAVAPTARRARVARATGLLRCGLPALLDLEGQAEEDYAAFPLRLVGIGASGIVELDLGRDVIDGPPWDLDDLEAWLTSEPGGPRVVR